MRRSRTPVILVALFGAMASACTAAEPPSPTRSATPVAVKVAVLQDLTVDGASQLVTPSFLGLRLALTQAADRGELPVDPEIVALDTQGDPSRALDLGKEIVADPSYVAVVVAPFWSEPPAVGDILDAAGLATLDLSGLGASLSKHGWSSWRRAVAGLPREAGSLAAAVHGSTASPKGVCLAGDGSAYSRNLTELVRTDIGDMTALSSVTVAADADVTAAISTIRQAGCRSVAWTGFSSGATLLRSALTSEGLQRIEVVGSSATKTDAYLSGTAGAGDGTVVTCACADLGSSTQPEAQRFIHDYQSEYGAPPGPYAAEAWDVGGMLAQGFAGGAVSRPAVAASLERLSLYRGLANTYRFAADGELAGSSADIHTYVAAGLRWVPQGEDESVTHLPVGTSGYLSVASCRAGRPFAYPANGRLRGFYVELAAAISRRLGLRLAWDGRRCRSALDSVANGTLDAVLAPMDAVAQGAPTSSVALSIHVGLVARRADTQGGGPFLAGIGPGDVVAVVRTPETIAWAKQAIRGTGARVVVVVDRTEAYDGLVASRFTAVADLEPDAWAAIEHRPGLAVAQSIDAGIRDVFVAKGPDAVLIAAVDTALRHLVDSGRYALLFAKYFPGTPIPKETGT